MLRAARWGTTVSGTRWRTGLVWLTTARRPPAAARTTPLATSYRSYTVPTHHSEPEFLNHLRNPGFDSQPGGPIRQPYLTYWPARLHGLEESIPGLLKRLQIWALLRVKNPHSHFNLYKFHHAKDNIKQLELQACHNFYLIRVLLIQTY